MEHHILREGGRWLGRVRQKIKSLFNNGENVTFGSDDVLHPPATVSQIEQIAAAAVGADRCRTIPVEMKYIIFRDWEGVERPVIFPVWIPHNEFIIPRLRPVSAGFCLISDERCECYGRSESLGIDSRAEDHVLVYQSFFRQNPL